MWLKVQRSFQENTLEDIYIEVEPQDGLELTDGESAKKYLGTIGSIHVVKYRLRVKENALEGPNLIKVKLIQGDGAIITDLFIEVKNNQAELQIGDIESDPTRMKPDDKDVKLDVTLLNVGEATAQSVTAELESLPAGITLSESYSGSSLLGNLDADSQGIASFVIDVDKTMKSGEYLGNLKVTYKSEAGAASGKTYEIDLPLKIAIQPVPLYEITDVSFTPAELRAGDKSVKMKITIKNVGEEKGESVRIKAFAKTEQPFTFDVSSDFVSPQLQPGQSGESTLEFDIAEGANLQAYQLDLEIKNVVENDVLTYQESIPVIVAKPKKDNPWSVAIIGAILVLLFGGFSLYKYHSKKKKQAKASKVQHHYNQSYLHRLANEKRKKR